MNRSQCTFYFISEEYRPVELITVWQIPLKDTAKGHDQKLIKPSKAPEYIQGRKLQGISYKKIVAGCNHRNNNEN